MAITSRKIEVHWNYLLAIEKDLENLSRFVEFYDDNFKCYSIEISRLLMASAAEIDVICRQICVELDNKKWTPLWSAPRTLDQCYVRFSSN